MIGFLFVFVKKSAQIEMHALRVGKKIPGEIIHFLFRAVFLFSSFESSAGSDTVENNLQDKSRTLHFLFKLEPLLGLPARL